MLNNQFSNFQIMFVYHVVLKFRYAFKKTFNAFTERFSVFKVLKFKFILTIAVNSKFHENVFFENFVSIFHDRVILFQNVFVDIIDDLIDKSILIQ